MTQALPPNQYNIVLSELSPVQTQPEIDEAYRHLFAPEDVVILVNPTGCLNDVYINGCIRLLFSSIKLPNTDRFAVFSTHNLPCIHYNASDESLWRATQHTMFWTKDM